ncbi:MAG: hypothetical protein F2839_01260 [Actinobacteria bacterium]|uniref:Unannotated protein n=1 Tax=freshwater metagenome TaxID=449393 RepID=A0A6J5YS97_9ZZZZ|nr:hypothetical protein [Actinomycetota bacterium]
MQVGYVVLYVTEPDACLDFWVNKIGMEVRESMEVLDAAIYKVGFEGQRFSFELVPLKLMENYPEGLDLATPSICFYVDDLETEYQKLNNNGIKASEISSRGGKNSFAFSDNEARSFAEMESE